MHSAHPSEEQRQEAIDTSAADCLRRFATEATEIIASVTQILARAKVARTAHQQTHGEIDSHAGMGTSGDLVGEMRRLSEVILTTYRALPKEMTSSPAGALVMQLARLVPKNMENSAHFIACVLAPVMEALAKTSHVTAVSGGDPADAIVRDVQSGFTALIK